MSALGFEKIGDRHYLVTDTDGSSLGEVRRFRPGWWPFKASVPVGRAGPFRPARTRAEAVQQLLDVETPGAEAVELLRLDAVEHLENARGRIEEARTLIPSEAEPYLLWWPTVALAAVDGAIRAATPLPLARLESGQ